MIKIFKFLIIFIGFFALNGCDKILEPVTMKTDNMSYIPQAIEQDNFNITVKALTLDVANQLKSAKYKRTLIVDGVGNQANVYDEEFYTKSIFPPPTGPKDYLVGIGDELTFVRYHDLQNDGFYEDLKELVDELPEVVESKGHVGSDGSVLLLGIGSIYVKDKTLVEIREKIRNTLIRNGLSPNFQLEISEFKSRFALIFNSGKSSVVAITPRPTTLTELAASSNIHLKQKGLISILKLIRNGKEYRLTNEDLLKKDRPRIYIEDKDQIEIEQYLYKPGQVYTLSGTQSARMVQINPETRESMADIMFQPNGTFANTFAKRSGVYLLRGVNPTTAYHLDAQNVSRILVASATEVRPNDIIFVAERPIISFSRLLSELTPLRILLRDIQNNNIP
ncbi:hypothetical protein OAN23_03470 [Amylibacter sp.]|nr:hypothetical protein [Amylibacter sp.]